MLIVRKHLVWAFRELKAAGFAAEGSDVCFLLRFVSERTPEERDCRGGDTLYQDETLEMPSSSHLI
jgi:hypothetical protein